MRLVLQLLLICSMHARNAVSAEFQPHPKFHVKPDPPPGDGDYFTAPASYRPDWVPSRQTVLYQLPRRGYRRLDTILANATIEDLPRKEELLFKLKIKCSPHDSECVHEFRHPFNFSTSQRDFCTGAGNMPIEIEPVTSKWKSDTTYELVFYVRASRKNDNRAPFKMILTHYVRIQLAVTGRQWTLESNGLFLRNWDPLFQLNSSIRHDRSYPPLFLTDEAIKLVQNLSAINYSGFETMQFLNKNVVELIRNAPQLVQATIGIGAVLTINNPDPDSDCGGHHSVPRSIAFMTKDSNGLRYNRITNILRLDQMTGELTFSRHGLVARANEIAKSFVAYTCAGDSEKCTENRFCAWLDFTPSTNFMRYSRKESMLTTQWPYNPYKGVDGHQAPWDECQLVGSSPLNVTVFAREALSIVNCPIICARLDQTYAFYKGSDLLMPNSLSEFTDIGAISVHKSGSLLNFGVLVTQEDSGEYKCKAGNKEAKLQVEIVSLPLFSIPNTKFSNGELPSRIYVSSGTGYSVNCTVYYSGMLSDVTIEPEFHVVADKKMKSWSRQTGSEFADRLNVSGSTATISVSRSSFCKTLTVAVSNVPPTSDVFDFSHRFVCNAAVSKADANRFGVSEYNIQSGTDLIVVPAPTATDITVTMSPCCIDGCIGRKKCLLMVSLKPEALQQLNSIGVQLRGTFKDGNPTLSEETQKHVTFDKASGTLIYETNNKISNMTKEEKKQLARMAPVFELVAPLGSKAAKPPMKLEPGSSSCDRDPNCIASIEGGRIWKESGCHS